MIGDYAERICFWPLPGWHRAICAPAAARARQLPAVCLLGGPSAVSQRCVQRRRFGLCSFKVIFFALFNSILPPHIWDAEPNLSLLRRPLFRSRNPQPGSTRNWTSPFLTIGTIEGSYKPGLAVLPNRGFRSIAKIQIPSKQMGAGQDMI